MTGLVRRIDLVFSMHTPERRKCASVDSPAKPSNRAVIPPVNPIYTHKDIDTSMLEFPQTPSSFLTAQSPNNFAQSPAQNLPYLSIKCANRRSHSPSLAGLLWLKNRILIAIAKPACNNTTTTNSIWLIFFSVALMTGYKFLSRKKTLTPYPSPTMA